MALSLLSKPSKLCPNCNGVGKLRIVKSISATRVIGLCDPIPNPPTIDLIDCPLCDGSGDTE